MTTNTNKTNTSATATTIIPMFNIVSSTMLNKDEDFKLYNEINFIKDLKRFLERSEMRYVNSSNICIRITKNTISNIGLSNLLKTLSIHKEYEWGDEKYLYVILDRDDFNKIELEYHKRLNELHLPKFQTEDGSSIFGYEIEDAENKKFYQLFGSKISKTLSLFFSDNTFRFRDRFVIKPISYINETTKEKFIEVYNDIDLYNEKILNETILRSTEELFDEEDDEDDWI